MDTVSYNIEKTYECDVLVIGAGSAGYCAAIVAGKQGCSVILLELDSVLGGNSSPNLGVGITGADRYNNYGTETGIIQHLQEEGAWLDAFTHVSPGTMPFNISRRFEALVQEHLEKAGVLVLKRHFAKQPVTGNSRITAVIAEDLAAFRTVQIKVRHVVIEASGDGHVAVQAGAEFMMGSESKEEFNERSAPEEASNLKQGTSLVAIAHRLDREVFYRKPVDTPAYAPRIWHGSIKVFLQSPQHWIVKNFDMAFLYMTEAGGAMDTIQDDGEIFELLLKQMWAEWDEVKNGKYGEDAKNWDLLWVSPKNGKRESRRFVGDVILTQTDLEGGRLFKDDIAYGGHDLDDHRVLGDSANIYGHSIPPMYGIPYRSCYSRNIDNLLFAGRLISATHLAFSSTRVMRTGAAVGEAVGYAASLCCKHGVGARAIYADHLDELQSTLLEKDGTILNRKALAEGDLIRSAKVGASSEVRFNDQEPGTFVPLLNRLGNILWDWPEAPGKASFYLKNDRGTPRNVILRVHQTTTPKPWVSIHDFRQRRWGDMAGDVFEEVISVTSELSTGFEGWHEIMLPAGLRLRKKESGCDADRLIVSLEADETVHWAVRREAECEIAEFAEFQAETGQWTALPAVGTMRLDPAPRIGEAENVLNGFHRRFSRGPTNMWISDPAQGLPQEIVLSWNSPVNCNRVAVTFDNLLDNHRHLAWNSFSRFCPNLVNAYDIYVKCNGDWKQIVSEEGNYHRFRVHEFPVVEIHGLKLVVNGVNELGKSARIYQISVSKGGTT